MTARFKVLLSGALLAASIGAAGCIVHRDYPGYYDDGYYRGAAYSSGVYYGPIYTHDHGYAGPRHYWGHERRQGQYCWDRDGHKRRDCRG